MDMTNNQKEEIWVMLELAYMPIALKNDRYNGKDFLKVAFSLLDTINASNPDIDRISVATVMTDYFNEKLDPKMDAVQYNGFIKFLSEGRKDILNFMN